METPIIVAAIALGGSIYSVYKSTQASKDVAKMNANFAKELKTHEYKLAYIKEIVSKKIKIYDEFADLAERANRGDYPYKLAPGIFDNDIEMEKFVTDWGNMLAKSFWLPDKMQKEYFAILDRLLKVQNAFSRAPIEIRDEAQTRELISGIFEENCPDLSNKTLHFARELRDHYLEPPDFDGMLLLPDEQKGVLNKLKKLFLPGP